MVGTRLIACCALGIEPEFKIVDPANPLYHVLADTNQRIYNTATRASIALKVEAFLKQCCRELTDQTGRDILAGRRVQTDRSIETGSKEPTVLKAGETLRGAAIRMAGSTPSAVRRLVTVRKKDPALAEQAIAGKITLRKAEEKFEPKCDEALSDEPADGIETADWNFADKPHPGPRYATGNATTKATDGRKTKVAKARPKRGVSAPAAKSLKGTAIKERQLCDGKMEFWKGSRSAILIPDRQIGDTTCARIILDSGDELKILRVKTLSHGRRLIDRFLEHDEPQC